MSSQSQVSISHSNELSRNADFLKNFMATKYFLCIDRNSWSTESKKKLLRESTLFPLLFVFFPCIIAKLQLHFCDNRNNYLIIFAPIVNIKRKLSHVNNYFLINKRWQVIANLPRDLILPETVTTEIQILIKNLSYVSIWVYEQELILLKIGD